MYATFDDFELLTDIVEMIYSYRKSVVVRIELKAKVGRVELWATGR